MNTIDSSERDALALQTMEYLVSLGNTQEEAAWRLAVLITDATMELPQRAFYSQEFCETRRLQRNTARTQLVALPNGRRLMELELGESK